MLADSLKGYYFVKHKSAVIRVTINKNSYHCLPLPTILYVRIFTMYTVKSFSKAIDCFQIKLHGDADPVSLCH